MHTPQEKRAVQNCGQHLRLPCSFPLQLAEQFFYSVVFLYNMVLEVMLDGCPVMQEILVEKKKHF